MTICTRSPQRDSAGVADPESPVGSHRCCDQKEGCAMSGVKLCGDLNPDCEDQKCLRHERHNGRHRGRRGASWTNRTPRPQYWRFVPPHRREGGEDAPESYGRRYQRPGTPPPWESEDLSAVTED